MCALSYQELALAAEQHQLLGGQSPGRCAWGADKALRWEAAGASCCWGQSAICLPGHGAWDPQAWLHLRADQVTACINAALLRPPAQSPHTSDLPYRSM